MRVADSVRLRVATWNIHACVGTDGQYDVDRVASVLASLNADIIGLQEVDWRRAGPDGGDAFDYLARQLGMNAVEGPNLHDHRGRYGNGLLTRLEVSDVKNLKLSYKEREPRGAIDTILRADTTRVRTLVTHLGLKFRERRFQVSALCEAVEAAADMDITLLLGDMNEWVNRRLMARAFTPAPFAQMITGRTFPSCWPWFPLDCIFVTPGPDQYAVQVVKTPEARKASDHVPLVADLTWNGL